jgi:hypothetical protein
MPNPNPDPPVTVPVAEFARELVEKINETLVELSAGNNERWMDLKCQVATSTLKVALGWVKDLAARHGVELKEGTC